MQKKLWDNIGRMLVEDIHKNWPYFDKNILYSFSRFLEIHRIEVVLDNLNKEELKELINKYLYYDDWNIDLTSRYPELRREIDTLEYFDYVVQYYWSWKNKKIIFYSSRFPKKKFDLEMLTRLEAEYKTRISEATLSSIYSGNLPDCYVKKIEGILDVEYENFEMKWLPVFEIESIVLEKVLECAIENLLSSFDSKLLLI